MAVRRFRSKCFCPQHRPEGCSHCLAKMLDESDMLYVDNTPMTATGPDTMAGGLGDMADMENFHVPNDPSYAGFHVSAAEGPSSKADCQLAFNFIDHVARDKSLADAIVLPEHYARFPIEPIRFIVENNLNFMQGNIVKYVLRWDAKNGLEDLRKAQRYLTMLMKFVAKDPDWWKA